MSSSFRLAVFLRSSMYVGALFLVACTGANIGLKTDFKAAQFEIGKTSRKEVIARLGLPQKSIEDADGNSRLMYEGGARLTGLCVGCGNAAASPGALPLLVNDSIVKNGAEYVFDKTGILIGKSEPEPVTGQVSPMP
jgi:hypothetical protein